MAIKSKALRTETVMGQAAVQAILAGGGMPALLLKIALANGTVKIGGVNVPAKLDRGRAGAIFPGSTSLAEDIASARLLMRLVGLRSAEIDTLLKVGDNLATAVDKLDKVGERVEAPVVVLKTGGREYNLALGARRTK